MSIDANKGIVMDDGEAIWRELGIFLLVVSAIAVVLTLWLT